MSDNKAKRPPPSPSSPKPLQDELDDEQLDGVAGGAWYAKFDGVDGSSKQKDGDDWIDVVSVRSWPQKSGR